MAESYTVQAILTVKDNMSAAFKNAAGASTSLGGKMRGLISTGAALQVGMSAVSKGFQVMSAHIGDAVNRVDTMRNFPKVMSQVGFSAEESERAINKLSDSIDGLPTSLDSITSSAQNIALMTGDLSKATDTAIALNNAFLASGSGSADAARGLQQYTQMLARGKPDMMAWYTLQETMGPALRDVAEAFGYAGEAATTELYDALQSGEITFSEFNDKLIELNDGVNGFAERALTASGGIRTAFTNIGTAITKGIANSIIAIDEMLKNNGLPTIAETALRAKDAINGAFESVADTIKKTNIKGIIAGLTPAFIVLKTAVKGAGAIIGAVTGFLNKHAESLIKIASAVAGAAIAFKVFKSVKSAVKTVKEFTDFVKGSVDIVNRYSMALNKTALDFAVAKGYMTEQQRAYGYLINKIKNTTVQLLSLAKSNIATAASAISNASAQLISAAANSKVGTAAKAAATKVLAFAAAHKVAMIAVLGVAGPIIALAAYMMKTGASADEVANKITAFADRASEAIAAFADKMPQIMNAVVKAITDNIDSIVTALTEVISSAVSTLPQLLPLVIEAGIQLFMGLVQAITQIIEPLVNTLPQIIDAIVSAIPVLIPAIIEAGITLFSALIDAIPKVLPAVVAAVPQIVKAIVKGIIQLAGEMLQAGVHLMRSFFNGLKSLFGTIISGVVSFAKSLPGKIKSGLGSLVSIGKDFIAGLWNGIKAKFDSVINKVKSLASKLPGVVKKVLGIASPSKVMAEVGVFFDAGLEKGILKGTKSVRNAATKLAGVAVKSVDVSGIQSKLSSIKTWTIKQPDFAMSYGGYSGGMNDSYSYGGGGYYVIEVPVNIDGREVSRMTAPFMEEELNRRQTRESRKRGKR